MTARTSRRGILKTASAIAATSSVVRVAGKPGPAAAAAAGEASPGRRAALVGIDDAFQRAVDGQKVPGVVAMAATDKGVVYESAVGFRDIASGRRMTLDTVFWIASMTKAVTATACMQLVERGELQLDEPLGGLLPHLAEVQVLEGFDDKGAPRLRPPKRPITLRHLLTHTAGFTYSVWSEPMLRYEQATGTPGIGTCQVAALNTPLVFDPGDRWEYGINIDWAGRAVEKVSGQSLEVYFREHIFEPLGMADTGFLIGSKQKARSARLYQREEGGALEAQAEGPLMPQAPEFFMGGGGLFSTAPDYMAFLQMLLHDGTFNEARVLKPETVAMMRQNQMGDLKVTTLKTVQPKVSNDADFFPGMVHNWGLSFDINTEPGPNGRSAGSLCWAGVFNTYFWLDPSKKVTGTIMTQVLPFADQTVLGLLGDMERGVYAALQAA
jgi:methyl acetate hydrolase